MAGRSEPALAHWCDLVFPRFLRIVARPVTQYNWRMTPEEQDRYERIDRQLEFLANNQAQLSTHQTQLSADIENLKQIAGTHTTQIGRLADTVLSLVRIVEEQSGRTEERFREVASAQTRTEERFREVASAQARTDERLNALISVVDRYFSNGRQE